MIDHTKDGQQPVAYKELEHGVPLSKSGLWTLQTNLFQKLGLEAWTKKGVPSYMTSNPFTAFRYAQLVTGFLRDGLSPHSARPINLSEPLYIFDLGAGTGRFSYVFLKQLKGMIEGNPQLENVKICYVMTDIVQANLDFCHSHNYLAQFFDKGWIDLALFKHTQKEPIHLQISGKTLTKETVKNPIILIGNYFFDILPQDVFKVNQGAIEEGLVTVKASHGGGAAAPTFDDPHLLDRIQISFDYRPFDSQNCSQEIKDLFEAYHEKLEGHAFLLPTGAFQALKFFADLSNKHLMVIGGDQGYATIDQLKHANEPRISKHGCFSFAVNYHAIGTHFEKNGGLALHPTLSDPLFQVYCGVLGGNAQEYPETVSAFKQNIDEFEPKDYWNLATLVQNEWSNPSLETILLILKLGRWDPMNFHAFYNMIRDQLPEASGKTKDFLREAIHNVWEQFYPIHPLEGEFIMNLGVLFFEMQRYAEALAFFQRSLYITGDNPTAYTNMAACYLALFNPEAAHKCFEKATSLQGQVSGT